MAVAVKLAEISNDVLANVVAFSGLHAALSLRGTSKALCESITSNASIWKLVLKFQKLNFLYENGRQSGLTCECSEFSFLCAYGRYNEAWRKCNFSSEHVFTLPPDGEEDFYLVDSASPRLLSLCGDRLLKTGVLGTNPVDVMRAKSWCSKFLSPKAVELLPFLMSRKRGNAIYTTPPSQLEEAESSDMFVSSMVKLARPKNIFSQFPEIVFSLEVACAHCIWVPVFQSAHCSDGCDPLLCLAWPSVIVRSLFSGQSFSLYARFSIHLKTEDLGRDKNPATVFVETHTSVNADGSDARRISAFSAVRVESHGRSFLPLAIGFEDGQVVTAVRDFSSTSCVPAVSLYRPRGGDDAVKSVQLSIRAHKSGNPEVTLFAQWTDDFSVFVSNLSAEGIGPWNLICRVEQERGAFSSLVWCPTMRQAAGIITWSCEVVVFDCQGKDKPSRSSESSVNRKKRLSVAVEFVEEDRTTMKRTSSRQWTLYDNYFPGREYGQCKIASYRGARTAKFVCPVPLLDIWVVAMGASLKLIKMERSSSDADKIRVLGVLMGHNDTIIKGASDSFLRMCTLDEASFLILWDLKRPSKLFMINLLAAGHLGSSRCFSRSKTVSNFIDISKYQTSDTHVAENEQPAPAFSAISSLAEADFPTLSAEESLAPRALPGAWSAVKVKSGDGQTVYRDWGEHDLVPTVNTKVLAWSSSGNRQEQPPIDEDLTNIAQAHNMTPREWEDFQMAIFMSQSQEGALPVPKFETRKDRKKPKKLMVSLLARHHLICESCSFAEMPPGVRLDRPRKRREDGRVAHRGSNNKVAEIVLTEKYLCLYYAGLRSWQCWYF